VVHHMPALLLADVLRAVNKIIRAGRAERRE
jgi:hypothetical protein